MTVGRYRKKPVIIEAIQWDGSNLADIQNWSGTLGSGPAAELPIFNGVTVWDRLHRTFVGVDVNDWIIKGIQGEFYPCKPDVFAETYARPTDD